MNKEERYNAFEKELTELCKKYNVWLGPDGYDILHVWDAGTGVADNVINHRYHPCCRVCVILTF